MKAVINCKTMRAGFAICMCICMAMVFALPQQAYCQTAGNGFIKDTFKAANSHQDIDCEDEFVYSDDYFSKSGYEENQHLATLSYQVAWAARGVRITTVGWSEKSRNIQAMMGKLGFQDFEVNEDFKIKPTTETVPVACSHKEISIDGKPYTVLAITPKCGLYLDEWRNNFTVGISGIHTGYQKGSEKILAFAKDYVADHKEAFNENVKVWMVGYSNMAGNTNIASAHMDQNPDCLGVKVNRDDIYSYCYGNENTVQSEKVNPKPHDEIFGNIHIYRTVADYPSYYPLSQWNYTYYGKQCGMACDASDKSEMLKYLNTVDKEQYIAIRDNASGTDPMVFSPKKITFGSGGISLVDDKDSQLPKTRDAFLKNRTEVMANNLFKTDDEYVDKGYEDALLATFALYTQMDGTETSLLTENIGSEGIAGAALLYVDFMCNRLLEKGAGEYNESNVRKLASQLKTGSALIGMAMSLLKNPESITSRETYKVLIADIDKLDTKAETEDLAVSLEKIRNETKSLSMELLTVALERGLEAAGRTKQEISDACDSENLYRTMETAEYLFFSTDTDGTGEEIDGFSLESRQLKVAATLAGMANSLLTTHNSEYILSWLKVHDSYYSMDAPSLKLKAAKKSIKASWTKTPKGDTGCQIMYSTAKTMKGAKKISVVGSSASSKVIKKLKSGKKYYVKARYYIDGASGDSYGSWSKVKTVKVK